MIFPNTDAQNVETGLKLRMNWIHTYVKNPKISMSHLIVAVSVLENLIIKETTSDI